MDKETVDFIIKIIDTIATSILSITALITAIKFSKNILLKVETLFGDEAEYRLKEIKNYLSDERMVGVFDFAGGVNTNFPQLKIERCYYNKSTMDEKWKGSKTTVRLYFEDKDDGNKRKIKIWRLK